MKLHIFASDLLHLRVDYELTKWPALSWLNNAAPVPELFFEALFKCITVMIFHLLKYHSAVQIYDEISYIHVMKWSIL